MSEYKIIDGENYKEEYIEEDDYGYIYSGNMMYLKKNIKTEKYEEPYYYFTDDLTVKYYKSKNIFIELKNNKIINIILTGCGSWSDDIIIYNIENNLVKSKVITEHGWFRKCIITYEDNISTDIQFIGRPFGYYKIGYKADDILNIIPSE